MFRVQIKTKNSELKREPKFFQLGYVKTNRIRKDYPNNIIDKVVRIV